MMASFSGILCGRTAGATPWTQTGSNSIWTAFLLCPGRFAALPHERMTAYADTAVFASARLSTIMIEDGRPPADEAEKLSTNCCWMI